MIETGGLRGTSGLACKQKRRAERVRHAAISGIRGDGSAALRAVPRPENELERARIEPQPHRQYDAAAIDTSVTGVVGQASPNVQSVRWQKTDRDDGIDSRDQPAGRGFKAHCRGRRVKQAKAAMPSIRELPGRRPNRRCGKLITALPRDHICLPLSPPRAGARGEAAAASPVVAQEGQGGCSQTAKATTRSARRFSGWQTATQGRCRP